MREPKSQARNLSLPQLFFLAILVAAVLVLPGSDIYSNTHWAWLYNHMLSTGVFLEKDFSMLSGNQPLYGVGAPSHFLSGIAWFAFGESTLKALEVALLIGIVLVSLRIFKNRSLLFFWYALLFIKVMLPDSYTYLLSIFLFYAGVYFIRKFKDKPFGDIAIALAGLNHPYVAVSNLVTIFFGRLRLFLTSMAVLFVQFLMVKFVFLSGAVSFEFDNVLDLAIRSAVMLFPLAADVFPKFFQKFANLKTAYGLVVVGVLFVYPVFYVPFEMGWKEGIDCYYKKTYDQIPSLPGNIRIVDDCRQWIYALPVRGMVTSLSPYFEGQHYQEKWTESKYRSYLDETNTSYVIFCKHCKIRTKTLQETGELKILQENFPTHADLQDYAIFDARNSSAQNI